jgi:hypothetical protein
LDCCESLESSAGLIDTDTVVFCRPRFSGHDGLITAGEGVRFIEQGVEPDPKAKKKRAQMLARALRKLGYEVTITPLNPAIAENGMQI